MPKLTEGKIMAKFSPHEHPKHAPNVDHKRQDRCDRGDPNARVRGSCATA